MAITDLHLNTAHPYMAFAFYTVGSAVCLLYTRLALGFGSISRKSGITMLCLSYVLSILNEIYIMPIRIKPQMLADLFSHFIIPITCNEWILFTIYLWMGEASVKRRCIGYTCMAGWILVNVYGIDYFFGLAVLLFILHFFDPKESGWEKVVKEIEKDNKAPW